VHRKYKDRRPPFQGPQDQNFYTRRDMEDGTALFRATVDWNWEVSHSPLGVGFIIPPPTRAAKA
jgi:hypothetical protein